MVLRISRKTMRKTYGLFPDNAKSEIDVINFFLNKQVF